MTEDPTAKARAIVDAAQLRAREITATAMDRARELTEGTAARTRLDPSAEAGRVLLADVRQVRAKVHALLNGPAVTSSDRVVRALRGIHTDLDTAVDAYTEATS